MNRLGWAMLLAFLAQGLISGCATPHPASGMAALAALPACPVSVWSAEEDLAKKIIICRQDVQSGPNGPTLARVEIKNGSGEPLEFEAQILYKDLKGWTLESSPWVHHRLKPGKKVWLMAPTIAPGTARFFIQIQPAPARKPLSGPALPNFSLVPGTAHRYVLPSC